MRLLFALIGFFAGAALTVYGVLNNPLARPALSQSGVELYDLSPLEFHGAELDYVMLLNLPLTTAGTPFAASNMKHSNASIVVLRNLQGEAVAMGTRLVTAGDDSDLLDGKLSVQTYTNIFWPNSGSLMMHGLENRWAMLSEEAAGEEASSDSSWTVSVKPPAGAVGGILGGSGKLEAVGGTYTEVLQPNPSGDGTFVSQIGLLKELR